MRADRLLSLLMLLQSRGQMTAAELANELEVSERTIYRDITALGTSGVPVMTEQGPGGGISLLERYRSDLTGLTEHEVQALFMLSIPAPLSDLGLDRKLKEALYKLSAALPATLKDQEREVRQRIHIDSKGWEVPSEVGPQLRRLQQAVWRNNLLEIDYRSVLGSRTGILSAVVEPYGLVAKAGEWYLVAYRLDHMAVLRIDRIVSVQPSHEAFDRMSDFDLVTFWQSWCEDYQDRRPRYDVMIKTAEALRPYMATIFGDAEFMALIDDSTTKGDGWSVWQLQFSSFDEARGRILALGAAVEVIKPQSLRLSVNDYAKQIVSLYADK